MQLVFSFTDRHNDRMTLPPSIDDDTRQLIERVKALRRMVIAGTGMFVVTVLGALGNVTYLCMEANRQKELAQRSEKEAKDEKEKADLARDAAKISERKAVQATQDALIQKEMADMARNLADMAKNDAVIAKTEAVTQKEAADAVRKKAEYHEYVAVIALAAAKLNENAREQAKVRLEKYKDRPDIVHWEWGRLRRLCDPTADKDLVTKGLGKIEAAAFDAKGERFVTGHASGRAYLWKVVGGEPVEIETGGTRVQAIAFSPKQNVVATGAILAEGNIRLWNATTGKPLAEEDTVAGFKGHTGVVHSLCFSQDGKRLLSSSVDGSARVWDVGTGRELRRYNLPKAKSDDAEFVVYSAAFSPGTGNLVVTASSDNVVCVWKAEFPAELADVKEIEIVDKPLGSLKGHTAPVLQAVFSPDGKRIVTCGKDNTARIWTLVDLADEGRPIKAMSELHVLVGHTAAVNSVAFSPDGKRVLTGSDDHTAKIWDSETGQELLTLTGHRDAVTAVDFSADGLSALTASHDGTAIVWAASEWRPDGKPPVEANASLSKQVKGK